MQSKRKKAHIFNILVSYRNEHTPQGIYYL